jgi:hypothetical protein
MSKEATFLVYCIEIVKRAKGLTGNQVYALFEKHNLFAFVIDYYELLHVHGEKYILQDIDEYILELSA